MERMGNKNYLVAWLTLNKSILPLIVNSNCCSGGTSNSKSAARAADIDSRNDLQYEFYLRNSSSKLCVQSVLHLKEPAAVLIDAE